MGKKYLGVLFLALGLFGLVSCTDFFSTSLAPWAQRDRSKFKIKVTASNVDGLIADYGNDPDVSLAILRGIEDAVKGASGQDKLNLESAALEAAVNAAALANTVISRSQTILDTINSSSDAAVLALVENIVDSLDNLQEVSAALLGTLPDPTDTTAFTDFISNSEPDKLALAAAVLLAAEAEKNGGAHDYISGISTPINPSSDNEEMAVAIADEITSNYTSASSDTDKIIKNLLEKLKLTSP